MDEKREILSVLDKGHVEKIDHIGSDHRIVECARVSYGQESKGEEKDKKLIRYLLAHGHLSPFEHVIVTFRIKAPIFVFRQLFRYRTAKVNEISGRYVEFTDEFYIPAAWRVQSKTNKQASDGKIHNATLDFLYHSHMDVVFKRYHELIAEGCPKEMARMILPLATYSEAFFTLDLRNLFNLFTQRIHEGSQWETRQYAEAMKTLITPVVPWVMDIWNEFHGKTSEGRL